MTGVGTPAYRWFDLITSLRSSAILLVLFLDDFVCVMRCTVMTLFVGLCCCVCYGLINAFTRKVDLKQRVYTDRKDTDFFFFEFG